MGIVSKLSKDVKDATPVRKLIYTICPVLVASNVALELGWLADELARVGAKATYLRSLSEKGAWKWHYNHGSDNMVRDGGNSPAIWAKADLRPTILLGLTLAQPAGKVIVRATDRIYRVADLKGRRFGIYRSDNADKIDHRRATTEQGFLAALAVNGLSRNDLEWIDISDADAHAEAVSSTPAGIWAQTDHEETREARALLENRIDAIFDYSVGTARVLERTGEFKVIENLDRYPDWTLHVANAPRTIAISSEFAEGNHDVVVAYLRAAIRAGRWINANPDAAAEVFQRTTVYPDVREIASELRKYDLVPNLSEQNLAGLEIEKNFLRAHGYIKNDVDIHAWADPTYLEEALRSFR